MPMEELHDSSNGYLVRDQIYIGVEFLLVSITEDLWDACITGFDQDPQE